MTDARAYGPQVLTGDRVRLRQLEDDELKLVERWWNDPSVLPLQTSGLPPRPAGGWAEQLKLWHANADPSSVGFAVAAREDDLLLGTVALHSMDALGQAATFGIMLGPPAQGRGLG